MQLYDLAYEFQELDIRRILDLSIDEYRRWVIWFNDRKKRKQKGRNNG